jgi:hypothetical protein
MTATPISKTTKSLCGRTCWQILGLLFLFVSNAQGQSLTESATKANFLYNFVAYTQWPNQPLEQSINLCVFGNHDLGSALVPLEDKPIGAGKLSVVYVSDTSNIKACKLLFVSEREVGQLAAIHRAIDSAPVLTVAESTEATDAVIHITREGKRLVFDVNLARAKAMGLNISSRVLQLARKVK